MSTPSHRAGAIIAPATPSRAKTSRSEFLDQIRELRLSAGEVMREVFPDDLKRYALPGLPVSTISKARSGSVCGALFRSGLYVLALRRAGASRDRAQRVADWVQELVDRLWPDPSPAELEDLVRRAQKVDGEEDAAETAYLIERSPDSLRRWLRKLREEKALDRALADSLARAPIASSRRLA